MTPSTDPARIRAIRKSLGFLRILWACFLLSVLVLPFVMGLTLAEMTLVADASLRRLLEGVFLVESLLLVGASLWIRKRLPRRRLPARGTDLRGVVGLYSTCLLIAFALAEAVAINGVVLQALGLRRFPWALLGTAFVVLLLEAPREAEVMELVAEARRRDPDSWS